MDEPYRNNQVPTSLNVNSKVSPDMKILESNSSSTPLVGFPLVTVCTTMSPLLQVTVAPTATVTS